MLLSLVLKWLEKKETRYAMKFDAADVTDYI